MYIFRHSADTGGGSGNRCCPEPNVSGASHYLAARVALFCIWGPGGWKICCTMHCMGIHMFVSCIIRQMPVDDLSPSTSSGPWAEAGLIGEALWCSESFIASLPLRSRKETLLVLQPVADKSAYKKKRKASAQIFRAAFRMRFMSTGLRLVLISLLENQDNLNWNQTVIKTFQVYGSTVCHVLGVSSLNVFFCIQRHISCKLYNFCFFPNKHTFLLHVHLKRSLFSLYIYMYIYIYIYCI